MVATVGQEIMNHIFPSQFFFLNYRASEVCQKFKSKFYGVTQTIFRKEQDFYRKHFLTLNSECLFSNIIDLQKPVFLFLFTHITIL